jgi:hypothetical protein
VVRKIIYLRTVLIGARCTTFSADIDGNVMLGSVRLTATSVVNHFVSKDPYLSINLLQISS